MADREHYSPKQSEILKFAQQHGGRITLDEATDLVGRNVYHNAHKHTGAILSNMVKRGYLRREKRGVFTTPPPQPGEHVVMPGMEEWARERGIIA